MAPTGGMKPHVSRQTARVHHAAQWRSGNRAACGARAAVGDAGGQVSQHPIGRQIRTHALGFYQGLREARLLEGQNIQIEYRCTMNGYLPWWANLLKNLGLLDVDRRTTDDVPLPLRAQMSGTSEGSRPFVVTTRDAQSYSRFRVRSRPSWRRRSRHRT